MPVDLSRCRTLLNACDLDGLFVEVLGWDRHKASHRIVTAAGEFALRGFAEKRGFAVFICPADSHGRIPDHQTRAFIDRELTKIAREHLLIYINADRTEQLWQWVRRGKDQPIKRREFGWRKGQASGLILERVLPSITFALSEEEGLTLPDVTSRATVGFDVEKVTKRFFERFQSEHKTFHKFITGIKDVADRDWYASVMLNRLMFCYFIQKKGLLDGDHDYLRNRLIRLQQSKGKGNFWSFYRHFLLRLFHEGLGQKPSARKKDLDALVGRIPYLNGGLFDIHELETRHSEIQIPDEAFERLFAFFDEYRWHLDERPLRENNEINPDVLGYIFEKYINQKQMGAYYTKEDITGYIAQNTILPFILDHAAKNCAIAFKADSSASVWRLLKDDPDAYIYEPVQRGVIDEKGEVIPLPPEIEAGVGDVAKRTGWNKPAPAPYALPTETWREHVARRQRCLELRRKLAAGEVTTVNDLITLNLDIRQFVEDMVDRCEGPELLRAVWRCLVGHVPAQSNEKHEPGISILDPTCGSGAFLFATLNILEPLYEACLDRMEAFLEDLERAKAAGERVDARKYADFRRTLAEVGDHPNQRYFILKSIIVNNLYGVDIMEEACEICKLRLFLKLVAQVEEGVGGIDKIEPLPDIDFNIRAGNTLVGFTSLDAVNKSMEGRFDFTQDIDRIETQAEAAATAFRLFRQMQTRKGVEQRELAEGKRLVRERLRALDDDLNRYLAAEYGVDPDKPTKFNAWLESHHPFHWLVDFYGIMSRGGFQIIIGNPPYINAAKVRRQYRPYGLSTVDSPDIYAWVLERCASLVSRDGRMGMIVPLSLGFSRDFEDTRTLLYEAFACNWFSSFGRIPSALFSFDVRVRNTIHLGSRRATTGGSHSWSTRLHRWFDSERKNLFPLLEYARFSPSLWRGRVPKIGTPSFATKLEASLVSGVRLAQSVAPRATEHKLYFKQTAYNWLNFCPEMPPCFDQAGKAIAHTQFAETAWPSTEVRDIAIPILNSKLVFLLWAIVGDDFHVTSGLLQDVPLSVDTLSPSHRKRLLNVADRLLRKFGEVVSFKLNAGKTVGNFNLALCRDITDCADAVLAEALALSDVRDEIEVLYSKLVRTAFDDTQE